MQYKCPVLFAAQKRETSIDDDAKKMVTIKCELHWFLMAGSLSTTRHKTTVDERWKNFPKEEIIKSLLFIIKYCNFLVSPPAIDHSCLVVVDSFRRLDVVGWIVCYVNKLRAINYRQLPFTFSMVNRVGGEACWWSCLSPLRHLQIVQFVDNNNNNLIKDQDLV